MVKCERYLLVITTVLALSSIPAVCQEPNSAAAQQPKLKFETGETRNFGRFRGRFEIRPTHVAELLIQHISSELWKNVDIGKRALLETTAGRDLSEEQRQFLATDLWIDSGNTHEGPENKGMYFNLYAVSEEDAKRMAEAMLEDLGKQALKMREKYESRMREYQGKIPKIREELKKQQEDQKELGAWIEKKLKEGLYTLRELSLSFDAAKEAKEIVLEMDGLLNALRIEIAGIKARLEAISEYRKTEALIANNLVKLEQIQCEQTIELAGALARKKTAIDIRTREKEFYHKCTQWQQSGGSIDRLRGDLSVYERELQKVKQELDGPNIDLAPPKVFENKVVIYEVEKKD